MNSSTRTHIFVLIDEQLVEKQQTPLLLFLMWQERGLKLRSRAEDASH